MDPDDAGDPASETRLGPPAHPTSAAAPENVSNYKILRMIGEGGMGAVYLAEQLRPIRRRVAMKVIKLGMDTREVVARFEAERQTLALMDHPHIAKVFDAGVTREGRPFFAMEYVDGIPIVAYCDQHRLSIKNRCELFISVCEAIHHAHQRGIIHRDIKPSNILVTRRDGSHDVRIIDFGLAKAIDHPLTDRTLTGHGQIVGTLAYMSPEQMGGPRDQMSTTTDVYSLGVVLYELLTGRLPLDPGSVRDRDPEGVRRMILDVDPPRPSSRVHALGADAGQVASLRRTEPLLLEGQLRGDLDCIVLKALDKAGVRRYPSASEMAADVRRYLRSEPVIARPPSTTYQLGKLIGRHKMLFGFSAAFLVLLACFGIVMSVLYARSESNLSRALQAEAESSQVSAFLTRLFEVSDPSEARGNTITAREILDRGARTIDDDLRDQPLLRGRLLGTIGSVYRSLGLYRASEPLLDEALNVLENRDGPDAPTLLPVLNNLAILRSDTGDNATARAYYERALSIQMKSSRSDDAEAATTMNNLAVVLANTGEYAESRDLHEKALSIRERVLGPRDPLVASSLHNLAVLSMDEGDYEAARALDDSALTIWEEALGPDHPEVALALTGLAESLRMLGDHEGAQPLYQRALAIQEMTLGPDHPKVAETLLSYANLKTDMGDYVAAREDYERALDIAESSVGAGNPDVAMILNNLGIVTASLGDFADATAHYERAISIQKSTLGPDHPDLATTYYNLANVLCQTGTLDRAETLYDQALAIREKALGPEHPDVAAVLNGMVDLMRAKGDPEAALPLALRAMPILEATYGADHYVVAIAQHNLACVLRDVGETRRAEDLFERVQPVFERQFGPDSDLALENLGQHLILARQVGNDSLSTVLEANVNAIHERTGATTPD